MTEESGWKDRAECRDADPEVFYDPRREQFAKMICGRCPVLEGCLHEALEGEKPDGVWGGMNAEERALERQRHLEA